MSALVIGDVNYALKGGSNKGIVSLQNIGAEQKFLACTATRSKSFKTFKGANKFMIDNGYVKC